MEVTGSKGGFATLGDLAQGRSGAAAQLFTAPYWWDAAPPRQFARPVPASCDVAIIGSGFTGMSAALTLLRRGRTVAVFEAGPLGYGASTRNGGQVGSGNQKFRVRDLIALRGEALAERLLREGVAMLDYIEEVVVREGISCHFERVGRFRGAMRPDHYDAMARDMEDLHRLIGVDFVAVPRNEQEKEVGTATFHGGVVLPRDAAIHPALFHAGLVDRVEEVGGALLDHAAVTAIEPLDSGFRVVSSRGETRARDVIVATNGYTSGPIGYLKRRIVPIHSAIIATGEIPEAMINRAMPARRVYGNSNRVFSYFRRAPAADRILWGGRVARLARADSPAAYSHLAKDLLHLFPYLASVEVTHGWTGAIGYTFDELPHLGKTPDGIHYAMGYCGTGVSRSTFFGNKIALKVIGDAAGKTPFDEIAFPTHPFQFAAKAAVPFYEATYRIRDRMNF